VKWPTDRCFGILQGCLDIAIRQSLCY
jgi:hypothetical protein